MSQQHGRLRLKAGSAPIPDGPVLELLSARESRVGEGLTVRRALPHRERRLVGPWCFLDHFGPLDLDPADPGMDVAPHPHCGLQTVTWLLDGQILHKDSVGSEQPIRPGQLNLMTAGRGISHAEEGIPHACDRMHGVQFWVALPDAKRDMPPAFEHHAELPTTSHGGLEVTVLMGAHGDVVSPATTHWPMVGLDVATPPGAARLPLDPAFEHALVVLEGAVVVEGTTIEPGTLAYLGTRRDGLAIETSASARFVVVGGEPLREPVILWWNFVVRSQEELEQVHRSWAEDDGRFGTVAHARRGRLDAPDLA